MSTETLLIDGPAGSIELLIESPTEEQPGAIGVVCHPHPLFQGTMHNKVTYMLARSFKEANMLSVRFNFRGVGKSEGVHDDGQGEVADVLAVMAWSHTRWPDLQFNLAGFSFGSYVALQLAQKNLRDEGIELKRLITVAPPVGRWDFSRIQKPTMPWLIVQGLEDELVKVDDVIAWSKSFVEIPQLVEIPMADHFFHGKLTVLRDTVSKWLANT